MLVVEVNDLRIVENNNVDGFLIGTKKISSEVYYQFTKEEVLAFIEKAHIKKKLVFLDATNIFHDEDFKDVKEIIDYLSAVDYVMYNDLMILNIVPKEKRMYYSTTYITNILDFDIVEEENEYVLVSPELSLEELKSAVASYVGSNKVAYQSFSETRNNIVGLLDKIGKIVQLDTSFFNSTTIA